MKVLPELSDDQICLLIEQSGGKFIDDTFKIGRKELTILLRDAHWIVTGL